MSKKIYVGNLPFTANPDEVGESFAQYGNVISVRLVMDRDTGRPRGFGFVEMENDTEADQAINALNGAQYGGRALVVNEARPQEDRRPGGGGPRGDRPRGPRPGSGGGFGRR